MVLVSLFDTCTLELIYTTSLFVANISIELSPVTLSVGHCIVLEINIYLGSKVDPHFGKRIQGDMFVLQLGDQPNSHSSSHIIFIQLPDVAP